MTNTLNLVAANLDGSELCTCANCGNVYEARELNEIRDPSQRMMPGEPTPAGECPAEDCGAFCFLESDADDVAEAQHIAARAMRTALEAISNIDANGNSEPDHMADALYRIDTFAKDAIAKAEAAGIKAR
jgi:hypothetical protein